MLRRLIEAAVAAVGLVAVSPLLVLAAIAIRIGSPGPALFVQTRIGRGERVFRCMKLRTMWRDTADLPTHEAPAAAVTPVGRLLRRTKVDELPQLWNVVKGEMSFVGPRPCLPHQTALIEARRRLGVSVLAPGITGLAQTRGIDMSDPERLAAVDAEYLSRKSMPLDLRILLATLLPGFPAP